MPTPEPSITVESANDDDEYGRQRMEREKESAAARLRFVDMIKDENFYSDYSKWSLKQHLSVKLRNVLTRFPCHRIKLALSVQR